MTGSQLEAKRKQLEEAKAELDAHLAAQAEGISANGASDEAPAEEADPLA